MSVVSTADTAGLTREYRKLQAKFEKYRGSTVRGPRIRALQITLFERYVFTSTYQPVISDRSDVVFGSSRPLEPTTQRTKARRQMMVKAPYSRRRRRRGCQLISRVRTRHSPSTRRRCGKLLPSGCRCRSQLHRRLSIPMAATTRLRQACRPPQHGSTVATKRQCSRLRVWCSRIPMTARFRQGHGRLLRTPSTSTLPPSTCPHRTPPPPIPWTSLISISG